MYLGCSWEKKTNKKNRTGGREGEMEERKGVLTPSSYKEGGPELWFKVDHTKKEVCRYITQSHDGGQEKK